MGVDMQISAVHLLFVIIIIIALCAETLSLPIAIGLISAALLLFMSLGMIEYATNGTASDETAATKKPPAKNSDNFYEEVPWQNQTVLGYPRSSIEHQALNTSYGTCYEPVRPIVNMTGAELDNTVDANITLLTQRRQRDKKASDGWALKDADYFRHNFDTELDDYENKPWWGRSEY